VQNVVLPELVAAVTADCKGMRLHIPSILLLLSQSAPFSKQCCQCAAEHDLSVVFCATYLRVLIYSF
jgi:hypothetical protein